MSHDSRRRITAVLLALAVSGAAFAHPGSGIAVDRQGNVYFVDTGEGVWKMAPDGKLTAHPGPAFHWLALDLDDRFARTKLPSTATSEMRKAGKSPTVLLSSDYPIAIGSDGALYYAEPGAGERLSLVRIAPGGARSVRALLPAAMSSGPLRWLNGIAAGAGGSILFTDNAAIHRVASDGTLTTVAQGVQVPGCVAPPSFRDELLPMLRGLAEAPDGTIWVAATGCSAVLRVSPAGEVAVALRAEAPWSPTGVALSEAGVQILEYLHTAGEDRGEWVPRVRRLAAE
ncbi:MAG TPA: hypothetical protein VI942_05570 [Thermoanaerobaculia bacterium]|nr:hypothetical protein [Thermoanaerobaculia bacterium]